jgi:SIR2-like domain
VKTNPRTAKTKPKSTRGPRTGPTTHRRKLERLGDSLLTRHLQVSWPEPAESPPAWFDTNAMPGRYGDELRTVAVVGAGASFPMQAIADDLADELEKDLDSGHHDREVELDRLEQVYKLDRTSFETRLMALCRTPETERKVRHRISNEYRHRHPSLLTYELLAHLLHHRFLDAIVSFNFDELLDQSIEDELGPNEYKRVVTERDCDIHPPASLPLYIKMHGTAAEPDSLRFTPERYYWTPKSIIELVEKQFEVEHLVVMNVGFKMASFDFQYLLQKPHHVEIYNFDPFALQKEVKDEIEKQRKRERERQKVSRPKLYDRVEPTELARRGAKANEDFLPGLLRDAVDVLEQRCATEEGKPTRWRSIRRHEAIVEILRNSPLDNDEQYATYLRRRTILEIGFAAARSRGILSIASMVDDRCGRYFDLYRRNAGDMGDGWLKLCLAGGIKESKKWANSYEVLPDLREREFELDEEDDVHLLKPADPGKLAAHLLKSMNIPEKEWEKAHALLTETLGFLQKETEIEVHSRDDRVCSKTFVKPVILKTFTALRGWTQQMLVNTDDYNELWAISETGDWIGNDEMFGELSQRCTHKEGDSEEEKPVKLLAAFDVDLGGAEQLIQSRRLPWGRHNRHMTIICKNGQPRSAIYFVRRLRAPTVTPVYLSNQKDLKRVIDAFEELWKEAKEYAETEAAKAGSRG